jgi:hypothetical protein
LFGDPELDGPARLPLDYRGPVLHTTANANIAHPEPHEIAAAQPAVDSEIEQRKIAPPLFKLEADADGRKRRSQATALSCGIVG